VQTFWTLTVVTVYLIVFTSARATNRHQLLSTAAEVQNFHAADYNVLLIILFHYVKLVWLHFSHILARHIKSASHFLSVFLFITLIDQLHDKFTLCWSTDNYSNLHGCQTGIWIKQGASDSSKRTHLTLSHHNKKSRTHKTIKLWQ
jgi:hypothetical protein